MRPPRTTDRRKFAGNTTLRIAFSVGLISLCVLLSVSNLKAARGSCVSLRRVQTRGAHSLFRDVTSSMSMADPENQPAPFDDDPFSSSGSNSDIDDDDGGPDDLSTDASGHDNHDLPLISISSINPGVLRAPTGAAMIPVLARSFYCLHEHICERAPPVEGLQIKILLAHHSRASRRPLGSLSNIRSVQAIPLSHPRFPKVSQVHLKGQIP
jgi:hypothetical protein